MRALAIGSALTLILLLIPSGHFLLIMLIPVAFAAILMFRPHWQPVSTTYRPPSRLTE